MSVKRYELIPEDCKKSFYGKCYIEEDEEGNKVLYSYDTKIMTMFKNGNMVRHYNMWSATTGRHIKAFCGLNKKEFSKLSMEN